MWCEVGNSIVQSVFLLLRGQLFDNHRNKTSTKRYSNLYSTDGRGQEQLSSRYPGSADRQQVGPERPESCQSWRGPAVCRCWVMPSIVFLLYPYHAAIGHLPSSTYIHVANTFNCVAMRHHRGVFWRKVCFPSADQHKLYFMEASAMDSSNMTAAFEWIMNSEK